ncbi:cytochrome c3 family protein [Deferribacteraceae bacterium V6Fe1]|nr:cytochrome c3 family protein [Deferribacteraceae bacterium V6Fe1]
MVKKWIILSLMTILTALCLNSFGYALEGCTGNCHKDIVNSGEHKGVVCTSCHVSSENHYVKSVTFDTCLKCHKDYENMKNSPMHTKVNEKDFVHKVFDKVDSKFYDKNCNSCHVVNCSDCHGVDKKTHSIAKPNNETCLKCHNSYFIGHEYVGLGIRDDHERYQRGIEFDNKSYMKMSPDIHFELGLKCADCHDMSSISNGEKSSKVCTDCHQKVDKTVIEHKIEKHMTELECYTCHSAWSAMEFGTFWVKFENSTYQQYFRWLTYYSNEYAKSSFYKINDQVLIGKNEKGVYAPIRPQFITFFTSLKDNLVQGEENKFLGGYFKSVFPHTVRRETVNCEYCHDRGKTYLLQKDEDRIFLPEKDGLKVRNFYNSWGFNMLNGNFISEEEFKKINQKDNVYYKFYIEKNKQILNLIRNVK